MNRLLYIEWLKLKSYKAFWILLSLYLVGLALVCGSGMFLLEYLKSKGAELEGIDPTVLPIYDFPDIWQNVTYVATFFKIFPAFIIVISVGNEYTFRTLRQNIIDGMSKWQWISGKLYLIGFITLLTMLWIWLIGFVTGSIYSHVHDAASMFSGHEFVFAYGLEVFTYLSFALLLTLLLRRSGFVIVILIMYTLIFEPFIAANFTYNPWFRDGIFPAIAMWLPNNALNNLIELPFPRYVFMEIQDYVTLSSVLIVLFWLGIYIFSSIQLLVKRDI